MKIDPYHENIEKRSTLDVPWSRSIVLGLPPRGGF